MSHNYIGTRDDFLIWRQGSGSTVEIYDIQVNTHRRTGKGKFMVEQLMGQLPPGTKLVWAITRTTNLIAQEFYEALGFHVVGLLRNFYQDQGIPNLADAVMYGKVP